MSTLTRPSNGHALNGKRPRKSKPRLLHLKDYGPNVDNLGLLLAPISDGHIRRQGRSAARLSKLTGGMVKVTFAPGAMFPDDHESQGHLFRGQWSPPLSPADDGDSLDLDDRKGPLAPQLASELRRVAALFIATAEKVESEAAHV